ncbi:MAG: ABC transporter permease [Actinomycetota bacterium]|nr:ABC transporter permease [Actinomycetota bacterium]
MSSPSLRIERPGTASRLLTWLANPWAETRFLWVVGIGYVLWSVIPVVQAVFFSFNKGRSLTRWEGFSLRWYTWDPTGSVLHNDALQHAIVQSLKLASIAMLVSVPVGVAFALSLHRWHGLGSGSANFLMMFSFVTPELILAVSLFLLFVNAFRTVGLGTTAQLSGLIVLSLAYPVVIVRSRLLSLGRSYEEAAMDLGASPVRTLLRVTLPLLWPSIFASAAIVFAFTLDDFVIVNQLSRDAGSQTVSMAIYGAARTSPTPAINAIGTIMLVTSTAVIALAFVVYRKSARRRGDSGAEISA